MSGKTATARRALGLALVVIGIGLAFWGYQLSGSIGSQLSQKFTGSHTDAVMIRYIGGAVGVVVGLFLLVKR